MGVIVNSCGPKAYRRGAFRSEVSIPTLLRDIRAPTAYRAVGCASSPRRGAETERRDQSDHLWKRPSSNRANYPWRQPVKAKICVFMLFSLLWVGSTAKAERSVFFEEQFNGPNLDPATWRAEILNAGARWCAVHSGPWAPGTWVDEGADCHDMAVHSPYGTATLSNGVLSLSGGYPLAFQYLVSRLPGSVALFPTAGDFTLTVRLRYDYVSGYGTGLIVYATQSTEPVGDNHSPVAQDVVLQVWDDTPGEGIPVGTALDGTWRIVGFVPSPFDYHEFVVECQGDTFTISVDGQLMFGPVTSDLRPSAIYMGNPSVAFWGGADWSTFTVDEIRVDVPGPVPTIAGSWGQIKEMFRAAAR